MYAKRILNVMGILRKVIKNLETRNQSRWVSIGQVNFLTQFLIQLTQEYVRMSNNKVYYTKKQKKFAGLLQALMIKLKSLYLKSEFLGDGNTLWVYLESFETLSRSN